MTMPREELVFLQDGVEYMKLCLDVTAYWIGPFHEHRAGLLTFYRLAVDLIGRSLTHFETADMSGAERIRGDTLELLPRWLSESETDGKVYTLTLETNPRPNLPSDTAFRFCTAPFRGRRVGAIRLVLPVSFVERDPTALEELAGRLLRGMRFHSGHAGYALNWDHRGEYASRSRRKMGMIGLRFPGIDLSDPLVTLMAIPSGIKRVNWLTLIESPLIDELGGRNAVAEGLDYPGIVIRGLAHGVMIRAGDRPGLGDVNRGETLEPYHVVGRCLSPIRSREHPPFLGCADNEIDQGRSDEWLAHFDT